MELSDNLMCLFSGRVEQRDGTYVVEIPERELEVGTLDDETTYRFAVLSIPSRSGPSPSVSSSTDAPARPDDSPDPPVAEGDTREVEIEDLGDQGDGITRVERGFVVIVPDTEPGERVQIEITDVRDNVAFGEVVARSHDVD